MGLPLSRRRRADALSSAGSSVRRQRYHDNVSPSSCSTCIYSVQYVHAVMSGKSQKQHDLKLYFFCRIYWLAKQPFPVSLFFRRSSLSLFLFSSSAASSASLSARRASRSFLRASLLFAASSYEEVLIKNYCWISLPRKWKGGVMMDWKRQCGHVP